jgi:hypothetical protein
MTNKKHNPRKKMNPCIVSLGDQLYAQSEQGQMVRIDSQGREIPRIRMKKKKKLKLRKELYKINEMDSHELANNIVDNVESISVINPKTSEQLENELGEIEKGA